MEAAGRGIEDKSGESTRENIAKTVKEKHIQVSAGTPVDIRKAGNLDMYRCCSASAQGGCVITRKSWLFAPLVDMHDHTHRGH